MLKEIDVTWEDQRVSAFMEGDGSIGVLLAHGAGTDQHHPMMTGLRSGLADGGLTVMTFNYPYTERGSRSPDRQERLLDCHRAAADTLRSEVDAVVLAGRSMGGRMGTYLAAEGYPSMALVLYAYPLHPAGKPEKLRIDQFGSISQPMLFLQGTRDALSRMELFDEHIADLENAEVVLLEGAGHGPRGSWGLDRMTETYVASTIEFTNRLSSGRSR